MHILLSIDAHMTLCHTMKTIEYVLVIPGDERDNKRNNTIRKRQEYTQSGNDESIKFITSITYDSRLI